jgi:hypothetical protein
MLKIKKYIPENKIYQLSGYYIDAVYHLPDSGTEEGKPGTGLQRNTLT